MKKLNKNLKALMSINKDIHQKVIKSIKPEWYVPEKNNFLISLGSKIYRGYQETDYSKVLNKDILQKENSCIIIGCGQGRIINYCTKNKEQKNIILLFEPEPYLIKEMFRNYDISRYIRNGELLIATNQLEFTLYLSAIENKKVSLAWSVFTDKYTEYLTKIYYDAIKYTLDAINQLQCNTGTCMGAGYKIAENDIKNLPYILPYRGVSELKNYHKDKPAILVATGPSLSKNIWYLKKIQDNVIIIAVAQALRALLAHDIQPDFITTVDYGEINYEHFKGILNEDTPLVCLNRAYDKIIRDYQGPKFICVSESTAWPNSCVGFIQKKGVLQQGGSVSHLNLGLATHLGCNPIALIGQDLGYESNKSHFAGADASGEVVKKNGKITWKVKDPRSKLYNKNSEMGDIIYVEGYWGKPILTNCGLQSFILSFENMFKLFNKYDIYNCTEGGARLKGAERLLLKQFAERFCQKHVDKKNKLLSETPDKKKDFEQVESILKKDIEILEKLEEYASLAYEAAEKLETAKTKQEKKELLKENEKYSLKAHEYAKKSPLVGLYILKENRAIHSRELNVSGKMKEILKDNEKLKTRISRNKLIVGSAMRAASRLLKLHKDSLDIIEKYNKTQDESIIKNEISEKYSLEDAEKYLNAGNWMHCYIEACNIIDTNGKDKDRAIEMLHLCIAEKNKQKAKKYPDRTKELEYIKLVEKSQEQGRGKEFKKSLETLKEANSLLPTRKEARWGLANAYYHNGLFESAIEEYEKLVKDFPDFHRFQFELAQVWLNVDTEKGLKQAKEVLDKTDEFNNFLFHYASILMTQDRYKEALEALEKYLKLYPDNWQGKEMLKVCKNKIM